MDQRLSRPAEAEQAQRQDGVAETAAPQQAPSLAALQRAAGNQAVSRMISASRPGQPAAPAPGPVSPPRMLVQRDENKRKPPYAVPPDMTAEDQSRRFLDPGDKTVKPVWTADGGYARNPSARPLDGLLQKGRIGGGFDNGTFMYVVDGDGNVILGKRLGEPGGGPGRATGMPHPTLIGGKDPTVSAAGEVEIRGGRIFRIDNQSGHFRPDRAALNPTMKAFMKAPSTAFHKDFHAESVHYDTAGARSVKPFRSLSMLKLSGRDLKQALRALKPQALAGKMKGKAFRGGAKTAAATVASALIMIALQYLIGKLMEKVYASFIEKQIDELSPKVEELLASKQSQLEDLLLEDSEKEVFLNVRFSVAYPSVTMVDTEGGGMNEISVPPVVHLVDAGFSREAWDPKPIEKHEASCGAKVDSTIVTGSHPVSTKDLIDAGVTP